ncbi:MAG: hypothetical protein Fur0022_49110 [Anaerolineales bacterium]
MTNPLPSEVIAGAIHHMNTNHPHHLLAYARELAGCQWAESAELTALDANGFSLLARATSREETHRLTFPEPATDANSLRTAFIALALQADAPDGIRRVVRASIPTQKASRYLKALCNHFDRKATAHYDDFKGHVQFPFGECELLADDNALHLTVIAESETMLERTKYVVADHLVRFANKETLQVNWIAV